MLGAWTGGAIAPASVPATAYPQVAFTATLKGMTMSSFGPTQQEAFKSALRNSLPSGIDTNITLSNFRDGSLLVDALVEFLTGTEVNAATLAANIAVRLSAWSCTHGQTLAADDRMVQQDLSAWSQYHDVTALVDLSTSLAGFPNVASCDHCSSMALSC